jgi:hypothetical protein
MQAAYQASPIKRRRRTPEQVAQLERQILAVLEEDHPQSIRHVYYRMTDPRLPEPVAKTDLGYAQVQDRISRMRRSGILPYGWITDMSRRGYHVETYNSPEEFIRETMHLYRRNLWEQADHYVEVWCESRSIAGVIERDCRDLAVSLYPCGGFSSITLAYEAAQGIFHMSGKGAVPAEIIYIGDYDPAGVLIDVSLERELRQHLPEDFPLNFHRLGITAEQVREYDLPTKPRKATDRRAMHLEIAVEAEAMPAGIMRAMLRDRIESYLPPSALAVSKAAEDAERGHLQHVADILRGAREP